MELIFDTETTGLPLWNEPATHPRQPDIIQLGAVLCDADEIYETLSVIINPSEVNPEWKMNPFAEAAHGITTERILAEGIHPNSALDTFLSMARRAELLICHNVSFDQKLVAGALYKCSRTYEDIMVVESNDYYCTMKESTTLCALKNKKGAPKWPKLVELYQFLFGEEPENQHDALGDVLATRRCYYELKRRGL
jgi:DNA polymerase III epsilon subunit-like protein